MKQAKKQQPVQQQAVVVDEDTQASDRQEEDMGPQFHEIDKLEQQGINAMDIQKLKAGGICTVLAVLMW